MGNPRDSEPRQMLPAYPHRRSQHGPIQRSHRAALTTGIPVQDTVAGEATKKSPSRFSRDGLCVLIWHRPTFEGPCGPTIIGAGGLNCRVRDGNGWDPAAMGARNLIPAAMASLSSSRSRRESCTEKNFQVSPRAFVGLTKISELLVPVSSTPCGASTPGLSTWWSTTTLHPYGIEVSSWGQFHAYMLSAFI
jgi:hypothetical protein